MRVTDIDIDETARGARLSAVVLWERDAAARDEIHFLFRDTAAAAVAAPGDALLAAALVPAIVAGEDVAIDAPVSRRLLDHVPAIGDFFASWVPRWRPRGVRASGVDRSGLEPTVVAAAFSGGVDSYYTALRERDDPISLLVTILGLHPDAVLDDLEPVMHRLSGTAAALGRDHLIVETNVRQRFRPHSPWTPRRGIPQWGAFVAAPALALGSTIRRFHIASSWHERPVPAWGTHPELDPLWSTEAVEIAHDAVVPRERKVEAIARCPEALDALYVCFRHPSRVGNCGVCEKCVGTALMLRAADALDRCRTMPGITPDVVRNTFVGVPWVPTFERLRAGEADTAFRRAIGHALRGSALRRRLARIAVIVRRARGSH